MQTTEPNPILLPTLSVRVRGEVLSSNVAEFRAAIDRRLATIPTELVTDLDFGHARADVTELKAAEAAIKKALNDLFSEAGGIQKVKEDLTAAQTSIAKLRLDLEKKITAQQKLRREQLIARYLAKVTHPWRERYQVAFTEAIAGMSKVENMESALEKLAGDTNRAIADNRGLLSQFERDYGSLVILDNRAKTEMELENHALLEQRLDALVTQARLRKEAEELRRIADEAAAKLQASQVARAAEERKAMQRVADVREDAGAAAQDGAHDAKPACEKCGGAGWVWWNELDEYDGPAVETGQDDTRYLCDRCHGESAPKVQQPVAQTFTVTGTTTQPETMKVGPAPQSPAKGIALPEEKEKADFAALLVASFAPVKEARKKLVHQTNIERAQALALAFNAALADFLKP